jgi:hypothetical protein
MAIGPTKPTPKPGMARKAQKKPYAKSHQEYIGNPAMQGGKTAKAKAALQKAIKGGAAKTAKKLAPRDVLTQKDITKVYVMGNMRSGTSAVSLKPTKSTSPKQKAKRNMIAGNIINDKSKTAMRAKIVEMNAIKKRNKK